jgi:hypothetical protein
MVSGPAFVVPVMDTSCLQREVLGEKSYFYVIPAERGRGMKPLKYENLVEKYPGTFLTKDAAKTLDEFYCL